jgi:hypothetical protein
MKAVAIALRSYGVSRAENAADFGAGPSLVAVMDSIRSVVSLGQIRPAGANPGNVGQNATQANDRIPEISL